MTAIKQWFHRIIKPPHTLWNKPMPLGVAYIHLKQPVWFVLFIIIFVVYLFKPVAVVVIPLFVLGVTLLLSWLWAMQMALHLSGQRELRFSAKQVGDEMEENFVLENASMFPALWTSIDDHSDFPNYIIQAVRWVGGRASSEWRNSQVCTIRGVFQLGPWSIYSGDPFGIFSVQREYTTAQQMIVYPPLASLRSDLLPYGKQRGDMKPLNQPLIAESILSTHARQYQPGDPMTRIHWRTTARKNKPYVKVFDPEAASRIWLIPDMDPNVHVGENYLSSEETLILLLAALASQLLSQQRCVGLFAATNPATIVMPQRGVGHIWNILTALAPLHTTQQHPFSKSLQQAAHLISANDMVIAATPSTDRQWFQTLAQLTRSRQGSEAWAYLIDCESIGGETPQADVIPYSASMGVISRIIRSEDIRTILGSYGAIRKWEFITTGTGKVVLANAPRQASQESLSKEHN